MQSEDKEWGKLPSACLTERFLCHPRRSVPCLGDGTKKRQGTALCSHAQARGDTPSRTETVEDVRKALGRVMSDLIARRLDPRVASATVSHGQVVLSPESCLRLLKLSIAAY